MPECLQPSRAGGHTQITVGTISGGAGEDLRIDLAAGATVAAVKALIESLAYANASDDPTAQRNLTLHLADAAGARVGDDAYAALTGGANPLGVATLGADSAPAFVDLDGDLDLLVGSSATTLRAIAQDAGVTVNFSAQFEHPVGIASLTSMADGAAAIARISNVTGAGFDLVLQPPDGSAHAPESVSWMVVDAGSWQLADGTILQAGLADPGAGFTSVAFGAGFADGPAVLSKTRTATDDAFVKTRMKGVDQAGFKVALEGAEAVDAGAETVGWIAVDMGRATGADGVVFEAGEVGANQNWRAETFDGALDAPGVVAGMAGLNGTDAASARLRAITDQGFQVRAEEDRTHDAETFHAK